MVAPEQSRAELRARIAAVEAEVERLLARSSLTLDANVPTMQKVIKQQREQIAAYQDEAERWQKIASEQGDEVERLQPIVSSYDSDATKVILAKCCDSHRPEVVALSLDELRERIEARGCVWCLEAERNQLACSLGGKCADVERLREERMFELEDAHSHGFIEGWHGSGDQDVSMNFSWDEYRAALTETKEENR